MLRATTWAIALLAGSTSALGDPFRLLGSSFAIPGDNATYDYIIVGGGTAGLTVAARLVEQHAGTVAIVEAGTFYELSNGNNSMLPGGDGAFTGKGVKDWQPLIDWGYVTTPQAGANNLTLHYAAGKTFGGGSARNFMVYQRGTEGSYQNWADDVGDDSYTWSKFLPWFQKSVHFVPPNMDARPSNSTPVYDEGVVGQSGPVSAAYPNWPQAIATWVVEGLKAIGLPVIPGFNSGKLIGQAYATFSIDGETMLRSSSSTAFLQPSLGNTNLYLYHLTLAKKILFDDDKRATGVVVNTMGAQYTLKANKEVIVSAGVFGSPQLLMVSGVGPAETLQKLDIPVVADRPGVGQNMQDHIYYGITYRINAITFSSLINPEFAAEQKALFQANATGIYTNPTADVIGWEKIPAHLRAGWSNETLSALAELPEDWPEAEYISLGSWLGEDFDSRFADPADGYNYGTLVCAVISPLSRGTVSISSADTAVQPIIDPNSLTHPADVAVAVAAFKRAREFWATDVMKKLAIGDEYYPGPDVATDEEILASIRRSYNAIYHASCTNKMGKEDDPTAVVDPQARVYGVQGLRVVDASSFPFLPPGHPQSTVYALAEKIACDVAGNCAQPPPYPTNSTNSTYPTYPGKCKSKRRL
ncbi:putative glucose-methanol-choline oxidoreductase [Hypoxylon argillaceum]|nr:putative glucose-methanol-choline oxidoreductase [Hypoxylon argillaceum]KAI1146218.1 putative glucose-methanol-choline oxidoreductase [Nemania diffusa]